MTFEEKKSYINLFFDNLPQERGVPTVDALGFLVSCWVSDNDTYMEIHQVKAKDDADSCMSVESAIESNCIYLDDASVYYMNASWYNDSVRTGLWLHSDSGAAVLHLTTEQKKSLCEIAATPVLKGDPLFQYIQDAFTMRMI